MSKSHIFSSSFPAYFRSFRPQRDDSWVFGQGASYRDHGRTVPVSQDSKRLAVRVLIPSKLMFAPLVRGMISLGLIALVPAIIVPNQVYAAVESASSAVSSNTSVNTQNTKNTKKKKNSKKANVVSQQENIPPANLTNPARQALPLRLEDELIGREAPAEGQSITFTSSNQIDGVNDRILTLKDNAEIRKPNAFIKGDLITYDPDTGIAEAIGNARHYKDNSLFTGPRSKLKLDSRVGWMETPEYELRNNQASGKADRADFLDEDKILLTKPTYTTCTPENLDWYFSASRMEIDQFEKSSVAKDGVLRFKGLPVFYSPSFEIPMSNERKSGWLAPLIGLSNINGVDVTSPYYVNIAPNRDATIYPRYMSTRGVQLGGDFRYLEPQYSGVIRAEYLPNDTQQNRSRWSIGINHQQMLASGVRAYANVNRVSDDLYADNLGRSFGQAITRQFVQEAGVNYGYQGWTFLTRVQKFQTLQPDPLNPVARPYDRQPQINARYRNLNLNGAIVNFESDYTRFSLSNTTPLSVVPNGGYYTVDRAFFNTSAAMPFITPGYFVIPKVGIRGNNYYLDSTNSLAPNIQNFVIPTVSLDAGMVFERDATELQSIFGRPYLMTLEPRLFYVYTPYRDQSRVPLLDTAPFGMGIYQVFSENTFVGNDRVADNNKVTAGITSRILDAESGSERVRMTLAQRVDIGGQRVGLSGNLAPDEFSGQKKYSDLLMSASTRLLGNLNLDIFNQYNYKLNRSVQTVATASWRPSPRRMINLSHRYTFDQYSSRPTVYQNEISGQWPISKDVYGIGRWNYDQVTKKTLNTLVGLEYDQECWAFRVVWQRFVNTSQFSTSQVFMQLELKGLSGIGNNPTNIIRMNIPGYTPELPVRQPLSPFERYE